MENKTQQLIERLQEIETKIAGYTVFGGNQTHFLKEVRDCIHQVLKFAQSEEPQPTDQPECERVPFDPSKLGVWECEYRDGTKPLEVKVLEKAVGQKVLSVDAAGDINRHDLDGCFGFNGKKQSCYDLLMLKPLPRKKVVEVEGFINVYHNGHNPCYFYTNKETAGKAAGTNCIHKAVPAKLTYTITEGE